MYINGENAQHLSTFLTQAEDRYNQEDFFAFVEGQQELDSNSISCVRHTFGNKQYLLVFGEHAKKRNSRRLYVTDDELMDEVLHQLNNQKVLHELLENQVYYDEDHQRACNFSGTDICCTIVLQEGRHMAIVYETGFTYIRVKTVWDTRLGKFFLQNTAAPVLIHSDGSITVDPTRISFVI